MLTPHLSSRFNSALKFGIARGLVPFDWGALRCRRDFAQFVRADHAPQTFTEKVRYKLARDRRPIARTYADKIAVRDYVRQVCPAVRLPQLLRVFDDPANILDHLPEPPWVMKASHGSGMVLLCQEAGAVSAQEISRRAQRWFETDYALAYWEWQYLRLPRRVLFEEFLGDDSVAPDDYKFYVIHQKVRFIEIDQGRFTHHTRDFFRPDWTRIDSRIGPAPCAPIAPPAPARLADMIAIAEQLSCDTDFLRVDLYAIRGEIYFGELTHSPAAGNFDFTDAALDQQLGHGWQVPAEYR